MATPIRRKLGELLLAAGVVDESHLKAALAEQKRWGGKLGRTLIDLGYVREDIMVKALSHQLKLPSVNLTRVEPTKEAISLVPVQLCERYGVFPVSYDPTKRALTLATSDPTNDNALREIRLELNVRDVHPMVAGTVDIDRAVRRYYWGEAIESSRTATPQELGLSHERIVDLPHLSDDEPERPSPQAPGLAPTPVALNVAPRAAPPARPPERAAPGSVYTAAAMMAAPKGVPPGQNTNEQLLASMQRLEKLLTAEVRSLRTLVELLVEKGLINRDEYLKRVKGS